MKVSYKKLWKLLIDKDMMKKDLQAKAKISWASVTKMSKNENVSMDILLKVCEALNCGIEDVVEFVPDDATEEYGVWWYIPLKRKYRKSGTADEDFW